MTFLEASLYRVSQVYEMGFDVTTESFLHVSRFLEEAKGGKLVSVFDYFDICRIVRVFIDAVSDNVFQGLPVLASLDILQPFG